MKTIPTLLALAAGLAALPAFAGDAGLDQAIQAVEHQWAHINYQMPASQRADAFAALARQEAALVQRYPGRAEPHIWYGITLSSEAGAKGGLGALSLAKEARDQLKASLKIDPTALQGSADASLGILYYKVPGWPIGFGDDDKAEAYFKQALKIAPNDIDTNYFYADFLYGKHRYREAMHALQRAAAAAPRPGRALADQGRQREITRLEAQVRADAGTSLNAKEG